MRKLLPLAAFLLALGWAQTAQAQYANKSFTLSPGYLITDKAVGFDGAFPISIGGTLYLEGGFEVYTHFPFAIAREVVSDSWVIGWGNHTGVRYLLLEDVFRPYVGLELAFLQLFGSLETRTSVGPGAVVGADYFVSESISLGVRGQIDFFISLNNPLLVAYGGALTLGVWFH